MPNTVNALQTTMTTLYRCLANYKQNPSQRNYRTLRGMLNRSHKFAGFTRTYVRNHIDEYPNLSELSQSPDVLNLLAAGPKIRDKQMCYVIAKDRYAHGCIAFETVHGKHLADLKWALNEALGNTGVEIMTISRPEAYGEYAPYHFVQTEDEFVAQVLALRP